MHPDGEGDLKVVKALDRAVGDGAIGKQGGEAPVAGFENRFHAVDVEVGFLLSGKAGIGQVFGGGRRAHGDIGIAEIALALLFFISFKLLAKPDCVAIAIAQLQISLSNCQF